MNFLKSFQFHEKNLIRICLKKNSNLMLLQRLFQPKSCHIATWSRRSCLCIDLRGSSSNDTVRFCRLCQISSEMKKQTFSSRQLLRNLDLEKSKVILFLLPLKNKRKSWSQGKFCTIFSFNFGRRNEQCFLILYFF